MNELEKRVTIDSQELHPFLPHINSLLHNALLTFKVAETPDLTPAKEFEKEYIAPGKIMEKQWRFKPTTQKPGRKKKGLVLR